MGSCAGKERIVSPVAKQKNGSGLQKRSNSAQSDFLMQRKNTNDVMLDQDNRLQESQQPHQEVERILQRSPSKKVAQRKFSFIENDVLNLINQPSSLIGKVDTRILQKSPSKIKPSQLFEFQSEFQIKSMENLDLFVPNQQGIFEPIKVNSPLIKQSERFAFGYPLMKVGFDQV